MDNILKEKLTNLFDEIASIIENLTDNEIREYLGKGNIDKLLKSIHKEKQDKKQTLYDYLLENKNRLYLLALLRHAITINCSMPGLLNEKELFVSPFHFQWYDNGVMFTQGKDRFVGNIGLYEDGKLKFAVAARDFRGGHEIQKDDLLFIDVDEAKNLPKNINVPKSTNELDDTYLKLEKLILEQEEDESKYQFFLKENAWVFGAQYKQIDSHINLDDKNIPDFTGVRVRDNTRDIFEIKQPFLPIFRGDMKFRAAFDQAWNQAEQYLYFSHNNKDYLYREKGLNFDNPRCYLIIGYNLSFNEIKIMRRKERMVPAITILTYNDLLSLIKNTVIFIKNLKNKS
ncbi:MAG: DUF4263 domain-containing protein [Candidatus Lokiarchaeota archaeon]|nr:DUF4263 domain-containing protein [Candidatus Lokiarchaeota archaeon]